jgi:3-hydroxyisobutyrate dehydrogenase/2-hydroxy-3-oxopropionate reductase
MSNREIGFIGLGRMGFPMARNLAAKGYRVHVFDVAPEAVKRAAVVTGITAESAPRDVAARAGVVFTALPNNDIVVETYLGPTGILAGAHAGLVTCDCSTVGPEISRRIHEAARARGVSHLDTPMLGSSPQAETGEVFFMVGGERETLATVQPMLDVIGRLTMYVGPSGTGNRIKLLHNALGAVNAVAVAESLALCTKLGVDPQTYYEVVCKGGGMAYSTYFDRRAMRVVEGNYDATFTVELMHKDVSLAAEMAGADLPSMPLLAETLAAYTEAKARWAGQDFSGVTHVVEQRFGVTVSRATPPSGT